MKNFRALTTGKPIIMGRKTFDSIGKPLPNRTNIIITRGSISLIGPQKTAVIVVSSIEDALQAAKDLNQPETMVIGGTQIYEQTLQYATRVYLTAVHTKVEKADTYYPILPADEWLLDSTNLHEADDSHQFAFTFAILNRTLVN